MEGAAGRRGEVTDLLLFGAVALTVFLLVTYLWPRLLMIVYKRAVLVRGFGDGPVPINTFYTEPEKLFAEPLASQTESSSNLMTVGVNHDTLASVAWLDLSRGPLILRVPDMPDRYYSVQFTDPTKNTTFAYVGSRTTGPRAGGYFITGPGWPGAGPTGMTRISSPTNSVLVLGRVLVKDDHDVATAYGLAKQIQLTPLSYSV